MERLKGLVLGVLPEVELTDVMVALDAACGFSKHLLHSAGAKPDRRPCSPTSTPPSWLVERLGPASPKVQRGKGTGMITSV